MSNNDSAKKNVFIVIDGTDLSNGTNGNAIANAQTPVMDQICSGNWQQLEAHGEHVGLEEGLMGNSEVGHLNIGAGRVVWQVAYEALVAGEGEQCEVANAVQAVMGRYANNQTDEFLTPIVFSSEARVKDNDTLLFFNYRADRMRQISECFDGSLELNTNIMLPTGLHIKKIAEYVQSVAFALPLIKTELHTEKPMPIPKYDNSNCRRSKSLTFFNYFMEWVRCFASKHAKLFLFILYFATFPALVTALSASEIVAYLGSSGTVLTTAGLIVIPVYFIITSMGSRMEQKIEQMKVDMKYELKIMQLEVDNKLLKLDRGRMTDLRDAFHKNRGLSKSG